MENEEWRDVENYKGYYQVSNTGKVKSLNYNHTGKERILKAHDNGKGYLQVQLCKDGKKENYYLHVLVAVAFIPNPDNLPQVNHKDEDKTNNCVENLEYCSRLYNANYGTRNKRVAEKLSKPIFSIDKESGEIREFPSTMEAERQTGIDQRRINDCLKGRKKSAKGFYWHYVNDNKEEANE